MKKIIAVAGALAASLTLAACGDNDATEPTEAVINDDVAVDTAPASDAGTYRSLTEDGAEISLSLNADGSYTMTEAGSQVEAGSWEDTADGACLTAAEAEEASCWSFAPAADGNVNVTDSEGNTMTFAYES